MMAAVSQENVIADESLGLSTQQDETNVDITTSVTSQQPGPPPPSPQEPDREIHYDTKAMLVEEDFYGNYFDEDGVKHQIKRFTWRNYNKLTVQVINYGARIISMQCPDRFGRTSDIVLGFDDLAGYIHYNEHPFGAILGRYAHLVSNGEFQIDRKTFNVSKNKFPHHLNGGFRGFDRAIWTPHIEKSKVIMSHISRDNDEGFPGHLMVLITFELCNRNEFRIDVEARTTKPTIVNLIHLNYVNLAGSNKGPEEIYKHNLTLNSNCYTVQDQETGLPTGEIRNVAHSNFDFQIPKCLGRVIGVQHDDGYDNNFCVNCSTELQNCFVARMVHPPSGRMIEIYSTQKGVNFSTGNSFGCGEIIPAKKLLKTKYDCSATSLIVENLYKNMTEQLDIDKNDEYYEIRNLIDLIKSIEIGDMADLDKIKITPLQKDYLIRVKDYCKSSEKEHSVCKGIVDACDVLLDKALLSPQQRTSETEVLGPEDSLSDFKKKLMHQLDKVLDDKNFIPSTYKDGKIHGKTGCIYKTHCGVAITPQNYPNAINTNEFPNSVLRPGEVYKHSTSYKFWIRAGNPNKWIKRRAHEKKLRDERLNFDVLKNLQSGDF